MAVKKATKETKKPADARATAATAKLTAKVVDIKGQADGTVTLPEKVFGVKVNKRLIAQAVRAYRANQRVGHAKTKTRGEVEGSTRKLFKQKGTGRARHGAIRAPIFVGGGIVFGPVPHSFDLKMPAKMKKQALASALTEKLAKGNVIVVSGMTGLEKTKAMAAALKAVGAEKSVLLVVSKEAAMTVRAARNIAKVRVTPVTDMHTYGVMAHDKVVFMKEAVKAL